MTASEFARVLLAEELERPVREMIDLLVTAESNRDLAREASERLAQAVREDRDLLVLDQEYWLEAMRDPDLRSAYAARQDSLRRELVAALRLRLGYLDAENLATAILSLIGGLTRQKLIDPEGVSTSALAEAIVLIFAGVHTRATASELEEISVGI